MKTNLTILEACEILMKFTDWYELYTLSDESRAKHGGNMYAWTTPLDDEIIYYPDLLDFCSSLDWQAKYIWPKVFKLKGFDCILLDDNLIDALLDKDISKTDKPDLEVYSKYDKDNIGERFAIVCAQIIKEFAPVSQ